MRQPHNNDHDLRNIRKKNISNAFDTKSLKKSSCTGHCTDRGWSPLLCFKDDRNNNKTKD